VGVFASGPELDGPFGITYGPNGNLFVASTNTDEVLEYDGQTGAFVQVFTQDSDPDPDSPLDSPSGLAFGPNGNLFVASFQGQEILEDGWFDDHDPVDWTKLITFAGIHDLYRDLIALRRGFAGTTAGLRGQSTNVFHVNNVQKLIAFHRWDQGGPGDDVVVVLNFKNQAWSGNYTIGLPRPGDWHVRFNSDWDGYDPSFGNHPSPTLTAVPGAYDGLPYRANISIGPYTALILSQ